MYITRNLESTILSYFSAPEIIAVVGPRQSGKTTMIRHLMEGLKGEAASVSFDDQRALGMFERETDAFIAAYVKGNRYLFIDEFQYAKHGGKILKYIFDTQKIKIIISGSSAPDLTVHAAKYLVGRILIFPLFPFDFKEFLSAHDPSRLKLYHEYAFDFRTPIRHAAPQQAHETLRASWEEYMRYGGYPRVVLEEREEAKKEILRNIYNTYFLREVRDILGLIDDYKLNALIRGLALQIGNLIEYSELSRLSGFAHASLKRYLNFLEKTYVCHFLTPFYRNKRTEIVKNPKIYFFDTGLRNSIVNDFRPVAERPDGGALLENGFAVQCIKAGQEFHFWRDKKKNEIDFVLPLGEGRTCAVEAKMRLHARGAPSAAAFAHRYPEIPVFFGYADAADTSRQAPAHAFPIYLY